jgi:hypothetical protein
MVSSSAGRYSGIVDDDVGGPVVVVEGDDDGVDVVAVVVGSALVVVVVTPAVSGVQANVSTAMATRGRRLDRLTSSILPDIPDHPSTVMVPVMSGWIWQK